MIPKNQVLKKSMIASELQGNSKGTPRELWGNSRKTVGNSVELQRNSEETLGELRGTPREL